MVIRVCCLSTDFCTSPRLHTTACNSDLVLSQLEEQEDHCCRDQQQLALSEHLSECPGPMVVK